MDLYQEIILEHSKRPLHAGLREPFDAQVHHVNPTCGDEVTLRVQLSGEGQKAVVADVSYDAAGCSISTAATSVLADEVIGHSVSEALSSFAAMRKMLTSKGTDPGDEDEIGDGVAFAGVSKYPARVKCALLGWMAFTDALTQAGVDISTTPASRTASSASDNTVADTASDTIAGTRTVSDNTIGDNAITSNIMEDS
jgi:nitrogen fixation protein NifU and related proteins